MEIRKLATLSFERNVGRVDRFLRLLTGGAIAGVGWYFSLPTSAATAMSILGAAWFATGVLSKCSIYYLFGYATCPISGEPSSKKTTLGHVQRARRGR